MSPFVIENAVANIGVAGMSGWLLLFQRTVLWRIILGVIECGALLNLTGLIWLGYSTVWPGEPMLNGGFVLVLIGICFFKNPLITR